jgi:tetratricopeptide (TPR) repeat protein
MDILKKDNYRNIVFSVFLILTSGLNALAEEKQPAQILTDSDKLPDKITLETAEKTISDLKQAIVLCTDNNLKFRIEYKIGMLYFKADGLPEAVGCFERIAQKADCPDLIKLCSFNMAGQIYRMQTEDDKALDAFEKLIALSSKFLTQGPDHGNSVSVLKLAVVAGFAKAEIYQYRQEYDSAVSEYKRILICLKSNNIPDVNGYAPLALDRISQFCLIKGKIEDYNQASGELIEKYPGYYRTGIVRLEAEAIKMLKEKDAAVTFPRGSFDAPARLIGLIKDIGDKEPKDRIKALLQDLCGRYRQSYAGILLGYHYAWLLDAVGEQKQANEVLDDICKQAASINPEMSDTALVISTLIDYAKLQKAIILGEENKYQEALKVVDTVNSDPNNAHLFNLADSIKKAFETLKREVPRDVNDQ